MAEAAQDSLGPRYAPEDPTLPKPWKGLIDGSTGLLYYWNPETNITQYERPAGLAPPLPPGPPPSATMPKLAPIPAARTVSQNTMLQQHSNQIVQAGQEMQQPSQANHLLQQQQQLGQQSPLEKASQQMPLQQTQQMPYQQQQHLPSQQQHQQFQQMPYQQVPYLQGQLMPRPQSQQPHGLQFSYQIAQQSQMPQVPYHQGQQQGPQFPLHQQLQESQNMNQQVQLSQPSQTQHPQGFQFTPQQAQLQQGLQTPHQQAQQPHNTHAGIQHGQQLQGQQVRFPKVDDVTSQEGKQAGLSFPHVQQSGLGSSNHQPPGVVPLNISSIGGRQLQQQLDGSSPVNVSHMGSSIEPQHAGTDTSYRQPQIGLTVSNQLVHSPVHPPMSLKMSYDEDLIERKGNISSSRIEGSKMLPQLSKHAALPSTQNQLDIRSGPPFAPPGHMGGMNISAQSMPSLYNHASFPNAAHLRPPPRMSGPSDFPDTSAADAYRQHHEVSAMGDNVPAPFMTFEATGFPPEILRELHLAGFLTPTPIQAQTWPVALQNRDIVAIAKTGSGKTLGYLIPAFMHLRRCRNNPQIGPTVLVLAPTRELASQIQDETIKFGRSSRISCTCLYGGAPKGPQLREIERGADVVVATPGRLNDILEMKKINFSQVSFLVLDEADRMLDMGFEPQIRKIVNEIPPRRQTLMYTATWPKEVRKIAADLLRNPVQVNIGSINELAANKSITQYVEVVPPMEKQRRLEQILRGQERGSKIIIFCSTKRLCDQLARSIGRTFGAAAIHGDKSQGERDHVLHQFRTGRSPILVATDVAARGLDIKDIRVVINYDFPTGVEDYVHRIGRTGRAGATGISYTFFSEQDWKYAGDLIKVLEGANQHVPPEIREMAARGGSAIPRPHGGGMNRWDSGGGGGRWDSGGGRGMRDGPGSGGFGGRDGSGPGGFGGRNGPRGFGGRGGRNDFYGGRGSRGRGFGGPAGPVGRGWHDRGPHDRYPNSDGRGRYDGRRGFVGRSRDRNYSRSPERVRTWGYDRSRSSSRGSSRSRSRSRSRSWSRSRSRSRSWSRRSWSRSRSRSRSRSYDRREGPHGQDHKSSSPAAATAAAADPALEPPPLSGFEDPPTVGFKPTSVPLSGDMSPMSPGRGNGSLPRNEQADQFLEPDSAVLSISERRSIPEPDQHQESNS